MTRVLALVVCALAGSMAAAEAAEDARLVDDDSQNLKREILELDRDLRVLEDQTLYPAPTRVAVFVAMDIGAFFKLQSLRIQLDGREVAQHTYTDAETAALIRGATQQLYVGNAAGGAHQLLAVFTGIGPHGRPYRRAASLDFDQSAGPRNIELRVGDGENRQQPEFTARVWP
ncbi:MAG: helix-turn-helix, AraC type [Hydrocarboniphaga sp.]|uniref:hypothetical protein n=1 Tax=Hydrocarboniphaga sp. TaxID=2033016 RepID=UPI00261EA6A5|nr:hypothetical protein [Hydrocarboniphaga sp.]MDB5971877.1 helix-turn-helix, AraC type [Hydrocarboniphaga sp.]